MDLSSIRLGCVGAGNMAEAFVRGISSAGLVSPDRIIASDPSEARREIFSRMGITTTDNNNKAASCDIVLLAVKPQMFETVVSGLSACMSDKTLVISIAAGIRIEKITALVPAGVRIVRVMPNTPMLVGAGVSGIARGRGVSDDDASAVSTLLASSGIVQEVSEDLIDAVTAVSGSGPAYVFRFTEALADAAKAVGLSEEMAMEFAKHTVCGAAKLMQSSELPVSQLRINVTSPKGTTEAALNSMTENGLEQVIEKAVCAARDRSIELSGRKG